jgi:glycosyltransferase involved in cell wall biosynthesis
LNIALIHYNFTRTGGMEAYLLSLVKGFQRQGDTVSVYACKVDWDIVKETGCTVHQIRPPWPRKMREFMFLRHCSALPFRQQYDLSISLSRTSSADIAVCGGVHLETIRQIRRTALFRGIHDLFEKYYERKMFETVPYIMAHSRTIADQILKHYPIDENKIRVMYPPIDTERFFPADQTAIETVRSSLKIDERRITILLVSCGHQCKGLHELLLAFADLDPDRYELLVAGSKIPSSHPPNVRYIGYIANLAPVYSAVDFTILPSHYEAFGLVVPESLQCGTPVIVTKNVGSAELLTDREAVFLADNNPETIVNTIRQLDGGRQVEPGFASRHHLDINQHIQEIKSLFSGQS